MVLVYVDDILITGDSSSQVQQLIADLHSKFSLKHLGEVNYFLGIEASITDHSIVLTQSKYAKEILLRANLDKSNSTPTPSCSSLKLAKFDSDLFDKPSLYRSIVGALQYLTLTRPDIAYSVNKLSQYLHSPTKNHWKACKRVLRFIQGTIANGICFTAVTDFRLQGFTDSDFAANLDDRRSTTGFCIKLGSNLLSWCSRKQNVVARSSTEAEYRSLSLATTELIWISSLFKELSLPLASPSLLWCDNEGAIKLAFSPVFHARTKHIEIDVHFLREKIQNQDLDVRYVPTQDQQADIFTKPLSPTQFHGLCSALGLHSPRGS